MKIYVKTISKSFRHPGNKTFDECERKFKTSNFSDGSVLFYTDNNWNTQFINSHNNVKELWQICLPCPKYKSCLVHETLLNTLAYVKQKNIEN